MNKILIWGTGEIGTADFLLSLLKRDYEIIGYVDSNIKKHGLSIGEYKVYAPEEIKGLDVNLVIIAVANKNVFDEINVEVKELDAELDAIWYKVIYFELVNKYIDEIKPTNTYNVTAEKFIEETNMWADNIMSEVEFWAKVVANPKGANRKHYLARLHNNKFSSELSQNTEYIEEYLCEIDEGIIYDIGCGLAPRFGNVLKNGKTINLIGIDPLAFFYNKINETFGDGLFPIIKFGMFEFIAKFVEENSADAVIINNALDHCIDPYKAIVECLKIIKIGGVLHLNHGRCEAINGVYCGLHQWNMDYDDNDNFIIWSNEGVINVSEAISDVADVKVFHSAPDLDMSQQSVTIEIIKKRDFEQIELVDMKNDELILASLIEKLMCLQANPEMNVMFNKLLEE